VKKGFIFIQDLIDKAGMNTLTIVNVYALILTMLFPFPGTCNFIVNRLSFFPDKSKSIPAKQLPRYISKQWIITKDHKRLESYLFKNDTSHLLLIYFHGNAGNIFQRLPELQKFWKIGSNVLGVGYRGYGESTGSPSEKGIYLDADAAVTYAADSLHYPLERIIICGRSIGTAAAISVAAQRKPGGLILITPLTTGKEYARAHGIGWCSFIIGKGFDNISKCKQIACPVLILHGTHDEVIPYSMGQTVYAHLPGPGKTMVTITNGFHNNLELVDPNTYWKAINDFIHGINHFGPTNSQ
jgi:uncharacterized protein